MGTETSCKGSARTHMHPCLVCGEAPRHKRSEQHKSASSILERHATAHTRTHARPPCPPPSLLHACLRRPAPGEARLCSSWGWPCKRPGAPSWPNVQTPAQGGHRWHMCRTQGPQVRALCSCPCRCLPVPQPLLPPPPALHPGQHVASAWQESCRPGSSFEGQALGRRVAGQGHELKGRPGHDF